MKRPEIARFARQDSGISWEDARLLIPFAVSIRQTSAANALRGEESSTGNAFDF